VIAIVGSSLLVSTQADAQENSALSIESTLRMKFLSEYAPVSFSADGDRIAFAVRDNANSTGFSPDEFERTWIPPYASDANIYVMDLATRKVHEVTSEGDNWLPTWSPDGRMLAFVSDRDSSGWARLWIWDVVADKLRMVSERNVRGAKIAWLPNSSGIVVEIMPENRTSEETTNQMTTVDVPQHSPDQMRNQNGSTVQIYRSEPVLAGASERGSAVPWNLDRYVADLAFIDLRHGDRLTILVHGGRISTFSLSPNGNQVGYTIPRQFELPGSQQILFDLRTVDLRTQEKRILLSAFRLNIGGDTFRWSPDGKWIALLTGGVEDTLNDCYAIELSTGKVHNVTGFMPTMSAPRSSVPLWDNTGHLYFVIRGELWRAALSEGHAKQLLADPLLQIKQLAAQQENELWIQGSGESTILLAHENTTGHDGFYRIDLHTGASTRLTEQGGCYTCLVKQSSLWVAPNGQSIAFVREDAGTASDLWISDSRMGQSLRLTTLNPELSEIKMGKTRVVSWLGDDGQRLKGTLLLPPDYKEGTQYPLVVWVYGGASGSNYLDSFGIVNIGPFNLQFLATRGYAVLYPDAPQHLGSPMFDLAKTVLPGVNEIIKVGIADPNRVGVMGHSYGGYSTLSLIVQTKRFAAAVEVDGDGNLLSSYGAMDTAGSAYGIAIWEHGGGLIGGSPWEFRDRYIENSPVFYLDRLSTPLLIVQGASDHYVPAFQADELFVDLRRLGREVAYAKYLGEDHDPGGWKYANQVDLSYRVIDWFDTHLKPKPDPPVASN
jgi:dipeptidyl aminopeptidase/acylaminoacyl peptidase